MQQRLEQMLPLPRRLLLLGAETFVFLDNLGEFLLEREVFSRFLI